MIAVTAIDAAGAPSPSALAALFEASHVPCYCRYWHFTGTKNDWLERCAFTPEENRDALIQAVESGDPSGLGLVAHEPGEDGPRVVGWMKLAPRRALPKLRKLPVYGALDLGDEDTTFSIGCVLVAPEHRGRGVARALLRAAEGFVRAHGGTAIEAYPRRSDAPLYPEEVWMGPERLFLDEGFEHVAGELPYPVLRKRFAASP